MSWDSLLKVLDSMVGYQELGRSGKVKRSFRDSKQDVKKAVPEDLFVPERFLFLCERLLELNLHQLIMASIISLVLNVIVSATLV